MFIFSSTFVLPVADIQYIIKSYNFDPYNVFLAIATNIPQRLKTQTRKFSIKLLFVVALDHQQSKMAIKHLGIYGENIIFTLNKTVLQSMKLAAFYQSFVYFCCTYFYFHQITDIQYFQY